MVAQSLVPAGLLEQVRWVRASTSNSTGATFGSLEAGNHFQTWLLDKARG